MTEQKAPRADCAECPLRDRKCVFGRGELSVYETARCVIVGEGPGRSEVAQKAVFVGPSGALLYRLMSRFITGSFWLTNTALCGVATPREKGKASLHCARRLHDELDQYKPQLIITLGNIPTERVLGHPVKISKVRGIVHKTVIEGREVAVLPTYHPAAALRNPSLVASLVYDFKRAKELLEQVPILCGVVDPAPPFIVTRDYRTVFREAEESSLPVLDLETASLDMEEARILCAVVATDRNIYILPGSVIYSAGCKNALRDCTAGWSGHNAKFDRNVLLCQLAIPVKFSFDTMLAHYVFDTRQGTHALKHIAQERYYAPAWDEPIDEQLKRTKSSSYAGVPLDMLYKYAAYDGYYQRRLTRDLAAQLAHAPKQRELYTKLLMPGMHALSNAEVRGVVIDQAGLEALKPKYRARAEQAEERLVQIAGHAINPRSPPQVAKVLFDELGLQQIEGRSTNAKTVLKMYSHPHPFVTALLAYREAYTIVSRYLNLSKYLSPSGRVHTTFHLHRTATGRLSSANPYCCRGFGE